MPAMAITSNLVFIFDLLTQVFLGSHL
jgi:hypothetical protein